MPVFRRKAKQSVEADFGLDLLSREGRAVVEGTRRTRQMWSALVSEVGQVEAVTHVEVSTLMGMVDAAVAVVSSAMQKWQASMEDEGVLLGIRAVRDETEAQVESAIGAIGAIASGPNHEVAETVAAAAGDAHPSVFSTAELFVLGTITDEQVQEAADVRAIWENACDRWDAVSGRPNLPLVGDQTG